MKWIVGTATAWQPTERYDIWHDRAAFHFWSSRPIDRLTWASLAGGAQFGRPRSIIGNIRPSWDRKMQRAAVMRHDEQSFWRKNWRGFRALRKHGPTNIGPRRHTSSTFSSSRFRRRLGRTLKRNESGTNRLRIADSRTSLIFPYNIWGYRGATLGRTATRCGQTEPDTAEFPQPFHSLSTENAQLFPG